MEEVEVFGAAKAVAEELRSERSERSGSSGREALGAPDPEVVAVAKRRSFTREYKMRIVEEADRCKQPGEVGMLLRRERLHSSHITTWRKLRQEAARKAPGAKRAGSRWPSTPWPPKWPGSAVRTPAWSFATESSKA